MASEDRGIIAGHCGNQVMFNQLMGVCQVSFNGGVFSVLKENTRKPQRRRDAPGTQDDHLEPPDRQSTGFGTSGHGGRRRAKMREERPDQLKPPKDP